MSPQDIRNVLTATPFRAFLLFTSDGQRFQVSHPDWALVTVTHTVVGIPASSGKAGDFPERSVILSNRHITRIEFADAPVTV